MGWNKVSPVAMTVRMAARCKVSITGVVCGFNMFSITSKPSNCNSHSIVFLYKIISSFCQQLKSAFILHNIYFFLKNVKSNEYEMASNKT